MKNWYVYLLECGDGSYYCGATTDPERRLKQHQAGKGARYTRSHLPVWLIAKKGSMGHGEALRLEAAVKRLPRDKKLSALA
jgi:predicted GIY-YIG superfamily endonuclease